ncbi:MAG: hypothetical protein ABSG31_13560 [Tepidisphaeraceae bacterium]|jgi:hypothetical protein
MSQKDGDPPIAPPVLSYEASEPPGKRPAWVYVVAGIYLLLGAGFLFAPVLIFGDTSIKDVGWGFLAIVFVLALSGLSLMMTPVRKRRGRPMTRRSIWIPIIASGILAAGVAFGGAFALDELFRGEGPDPFWIVFGAAIFVWLFWTVIFGAIAIHHSPDSIGGALHRTLIAGSLLELVVAVPAHIIVRRRTECCAGIGTGIGICVGVVVAFISFGPSVYLLYHQRGRKIGRDARAARGRAG